MRTLLADVHFLNSVKMAAMPQSQKPSINARLFFPAIIGAYILLDWVSNIHPSHQLNITPWSPAAGLALVLLLRLPKLGPPLLCCAIFLAEIFIRQGVAGWPTALLASSTLTAGYFALSKALRQGLFANDREFVVWLGTIVAGTLLNSMLFILIMGLSGLIPSGAWGGAIVRHWIGDLVGIVVFMPMFWQLSSAPGRRRLFVDGWNFQTFGYIGLTLAITWLGFGLGPAAASKYFYFLFLPVIWAASRQGVTGAAISAVAVQLMIIIAVLSLGFQELPVFELQLLALVLTTVGFFIGVTVDERRQASEQLRHSLRLAAASEMAAALAHELNQPLTALKMYGSACRQLLQRGETGDSLGDAIDRIMSESTRAADILHRLRDFFRTGGTRLCRTNLDDLLANAWASFENNNSASGVEISFPSPSGVTLWADPLQLEVVVRNLLANALDATIDLETRKIAIRIDQSVNDQVQISVEDNGSGVGSSVSNRLFEPFVSSKSTGLGLGLAMSRAIVEAHGGNLWAEAGEHGIFKLTLPLEGKHANAE